MRKILGLLTPKERLQLLLVLGALLSLAGVEVVGIAAIAAFIVLISDPAAIENNRWIGWLYVQLGSPEERQFVAAAGVGLFAIILFRNAYSAFCVWVRLHFLHHTRKAMATRLLQSYMVHPYSFFQQANSAALTKNVTYEANQLVTGYLFSWMTIIADAVMGTAIVGLLLWNDPLMTLIAGSALGGLAGAFLGLSRGRVRRLGQTHRQLNERIYRTTAEAFGGIKELKVLGRETYFTDAFFDASHRFARTTISYMLFTELPRFGLEIIVMGGILTMTLVVLSQTGDMSQVAGTMALFVAALYRLMPTLHRLINSFTGLRFSQAILDDLASVMKFGEANRKRMAESVVPMVFNDHIRLEDVRFRYLGAAEDTIKGVSLDIPRNVSIAFIGPTGVGKTTLVDIVLGLLEPTRGRLEVDGQPISRENTRSWQANIGYVPQQIHLADDTIRRNIALGVPDDEVDEARIAEAAKTAHLHDFVMTLPEGYDTVVGERGIRLSGGQRQRVGIARVLYNQANLLVLDEATSSLDGITEAVIEEAIKELAGRATVITIAHRLTTVRHCDAIYLMEGGRIVASGTYGELMQSNETFRAMARATA